MRRILTAAQMKAADENTIQKMEIPSLVLMERAALACVDELLNGTWDTKRVLAVCGPGNNGGDGAAVARILKTKGVDAELFCIGNSEKYREGMRVQKKIAENACHTCQDAIGSADCCIFYSRIIWNKVTYQKISNIKTPFSTI